MRVTTSESFYSQVFCGWTYVFTSRPILSSILRAASDVSDLNKPYQNVFNGQTQRHGSDDSFDADYTEKLRKLSESQKYVKSASHLPTSKQPAVPSQRSVNHSLPNPLGYPVLPPGQYHSASSLPTPLMTPPSTGMQFAPPQQVHQNTHSAASANHAASSAASSAQVSNRHVSIRVIIL